MFRRDSIWFGLLIGTILPGLFYLLLHFIGRFIESEHLLFRPFQGNKLMLISLVINLVTIRIYFVNLKMDKTGRGVLIATFALIMIFFIFFKHI
jgi:hypothetical protein